jgi:nitroreductase
LELQAAIRNRRSIRNYQEKQVPENILNEIIEAGAWAPFGAQRWFIIVVKEHETKRAILEDFYAQGRNLHVLKAPVDIVVCCDLRDQDWPEVAKKDHGKKDFKMIFAVQETAAMIQNMLLTAHELGLGTCWNGSFNEARVATVLGIPEDVRPVAIVSLGYPKEKPDAPRRKALNEIVYKEKFGCSD